MKKMMSLIIILFIYSCKNDKLAKNSSVEAFYFKESYRHPSSLACNHWKPTKEGLNHEQFYYKKLTDSVFIKNFDNYFINLKAIDTLYDFSVHVKLIYKNDKKTDSICLGKTFGIQINGVQMTDHKDFHFFLLNEIYTNPGYSIDFRNKNSTK